MLLASRRPISVVSHSYRASALAIVLGALMLALGGCGGMRLMYSFADNYYVGIVQDYFDPTSEQLRAVRTKSKSALKLLMPPKARPARCAGRN